MEQTVQRRVRIIPAKRDTDTPQPGKKKHQRVAAYCRVYTDSEEQITSYEAHQLRGAESLLHPEDRGESRLGAGRHLC